MEQPKFNYGDKVRKVGGSYQAEGTIVGVVVTTSDDGALCIRVLGA